MLVIMSSKLAISRVSIGSHSLRQVARKELPGAAERAHVVREQGYDRSS
jgi:hypothetical protein